MQLTAFADVFREFGLQTTVSGGRIVFIGTRQQAEEENDRVCRLLHSKNLSQSKKRLLIQASERCEYMSAATA